MRPPTFFVQTENIGLPGHRELTLIAPGVTPPFFLSLCLVFSANKVYYFSILAFFLKE